MAREYMRRVAMTGFRAAAARLVMLLAATLLPRTATAHGASLDWHGPSPDALLVLLPLLATGSLYAIGMFRRGSLAGFRPHDSGRAAAFFGALALLLLALAGPLDAWSAASFAAHMGQHMVLLAMASPLLVLGRPASALLRALPPWARRPVLLPRRWPGASSVRHLASSLGVCGVFHGVALWAWHIPLFFEAALRSDLVHWVEHITLLLGGVLYWRSLLRARGSSTGWALASLLTTLLHTGVLGALLTLAPRPLYGAYEARLGGAAALTDQQLAGLIMWVPMGTLYLVAALALAARALGPEREACSPT